jgi:hypothetical protein
MTDPLTQHEQEIAAGLRCPRCGSDERDERRTASLADPASLTDEELDAEKRDHEWHGESPAKETR